MAFCKFSSEYVASNQTSVDNLFISEFMPYASEACVKVYLYGLYKSSNPNEYDNTLEYFSSVLNLTPQEIEDCFIYWQEQGLVKILNTVPFEVRYMPLKNVLNNKSKLKPGKYSAFASQAQEIIEGRMITPNEYNEYFTFLNTFNMQPEALLMIIKYCVNLKGNNTGYSYILTVAGNWANEGIKTTENVEEKLLIFEKVGKDIFEILKLCGVKRQATIAEREQFVKWTKEFGFDLKTIKFVIKSIENKQNNVNFEKTDTKLTKYYEMKLLSEKEISEFEEEKTALFDLARKVNKRIGVYYENMEPIVENYISKWKNLGHTENSLLLICDYCFKNSIRTLEGVNNIILKLYKLGIVSAEAMQKYAEEILTKDQKIKEILNELGLVRLVNSQDRNFYNIWTNSWNISDELIEFGISLAKDKFQPMQYLNKLFSNWHMNKISTLAEAKKSPVESNNKPKVSANKGRSYKAEELNALFDNLDEIEI